METRVIAFALAMVLLCPLPSGQWVQTHGPCGGYATCFTVSGTNIFAGTLGGGVFSTNGGTSWKIVNNGLTYTNVWAVAKMKAEPAKK